MKVTLDTNCIIDLERNEGGVASLRTLISFHENEVIDLQVLGIAASERMPTGGYIDNFLEFSKRIKVLSQRPVEILQPIGRWGVTFWDEGLWADDSMIALEEKISLVLFPTHEYEWADYAKNNGIDPNAELGDDHVGWKKWRNRICDCSCLWCHMYYEGDIFVTRDNNFLQSKRKILETLGAKSILTPLAACEAVHRLQVKSPEEI